MGKDLSGYRIEVWVEFRLNVPGGHRVIGYSCDPNMTTGKAGETAVQVFVLTQDGKSGYIIKDTRIAICEPGVARTKTSAERTKELVAEQEAIALIA